MSDSCISARRHGMTHDTTDARTVVADMARLYTIDAVSRHARKMLGAVASDPRRLHLPQVAVECERRADGVGYVALLVVIPVDGGPRFDTFWGFGWRDALENLVEWLDDLRSDFPAAEAFEAAMDCGADTPPWAAVR